MVDTFRLGSRTMAMKRTQNPMPIISISSQWPVMIHRATRHEEKNCARSSGNVNLPKTQHEYFFVIKIGLFEQQHLKSRVQTGRSKNANVTIAKTLKKFILINLY